MGVERAVTRWYTLHQCIQREIDALKLQLEAARAHGLSDHERAATERQLAETWARLQALGPCPKPMMG